TRLVSLCAGCGHQILDRYILRVSPDLEWHATCLKCVACQRNLDQSSTCFIKDGKTLCKDDYRRLYAIKCAKCHKPFTSLDHVMRAQFHVYHAHCFRCEGCDRQLLTGDEFTFREGSLFCTASHELSGLLMASSGHALHRTLPEKSAKEAGKHTTRACFNVSMFHLTRALCGRKLLLCLSYKLVVEELFPALSPESPGVDVLMSSLDFHSFSPCWKMLSSFSVYSDADCMQDQHLASAAHVQNFGWEDAPVPSELPDTPCILTSNPVQGNK
ncbi:hypothetical protein P4O66_005520, partial [Electrophorus voltai]